MDEDGRRDYRLRRPIPRAQEGWLQRSSKPGNPLARRRHSRRIHTSEHGRNEGIVAPRRRAVAALSDTLRSLVFGLWPLVFVFWFWCRCEGCFWHEIVQR